MKKTIALLLIGWLCTLGFSTYANPPTVSHDVVIIEQDNSDGPDLTGFLLKFDAILPCNLVEFNFPTYQMVWKIGSPSDQLHEHYLLLSNATNLIASGLHRLRNSK